MAGARVEGAFGLIKVPERADREIWIISIDEWLECEEALVTAGDCSNGGAVTLGPWVEGEQWQLEFIPKKNSRAMPKAADLKFYVESKREDCRGEDLRFIGVEEGSAVMVGQDDAKYLNIGVGKGPKN